MRNCWNCSNSSWTTSCWTRNWSNSTSCWRTTNWSCWSWRATNCLTKYCSVWNWTTNCSNSRRSYSNPSAAPKGFNPGHNGASGEVPPRRNGCPTHPTYSLTSPVQCKRKIQKLRPPIPAYTIRSRPARTPRVALRVSTTQGECSTRELTRVAAVHGTSPSLTILRPFSTSSFHNGLNRCFGIC